MYICTCTVHATDIHWLFFLDGTVVFIWREFFSTCFGGWDKPIANWMHTFSIFFLQMIAVNVEIFVVTIFHGLNFWRDKYLWVRVAHCYYCCWFFVYKFSWVWFSWGVACPQQLIPNENYCAYGVNPQVVKLHGEGDLYIHVQVSLPAGIAWCPVTLCHSCLAIFGGNW